MVAAGVVVASTAGQGDTDGAWPILWGANPITGTNVALAVDEDSIGDAERAHQTERVAFVAVEPLAAPAGPTGTQSNPAVSAITRFEYDDLGRVTRRTDPNANVWTYSYDLAGNVLTAIDPLLKQTVSTYHVTNQVASVRDPMNRVTNTVFDVAGRVTGTSYVGTGTTALWATSVGLDPDGNVTSSTTARNYTTTYAYDPIGRLTNVVAPVSTGVTITTSYGYDAAGNATRVTDGRNNIWRYTFNEWGRPVDTIEPSTTAHPNTTDRTWTLVYDAAGQVTQDRQPGGILIAHNYDDLGRITSQVSGGAARTWSYDTASRVTAIGTPAGAQRFTYDDRGLMVSSLGPEGNTWASYDTGGRLTSRRDAAGLHTYTWTPRDELATYTNPAAGSTATYTWNDASQLSSVTYGAGATRLNRAFSYTAEGWLDVDASTNAAGTTIAATNYDYNPDGSVSQQVVTMPGNGGAGAATYAYDQSGRLTSWTRGGSVTTAYGWDNNGNRTSETAPGISRTWTYDERNRLLTGPEGTYAHTPRGTLASITPAAGPATTFGFDNLGRLVASAVGTDTARYRYDSLDRVATRNATPFTYAGASIDPTSDGVFTYARTPSGSLAGVTTGSAGTWVTRNRHGDIDLQFSTTTGSAVSTHTWDPFGNPLAETAAVDPYVGYQSDWTEPVTGDVWMGARWYDPASATFRSRDTVFGELRTPVSLNRYTYAAANPVGYTDPDGHRFCESQRCTSTGDRAHVSGGRHNAAGSATAQASARNHRQRQQAATRDWLATLANMTDRERADLLERGVQGQRFDMLDAPGSTEFYIEGLLVEAAERNLGSIAGDFNEAQRFMSIAPPHVALTIVLEHAGWSIATEHTNTGLTGEPWIVLNMTDPNGRTYQAQVDPDDGHVVYAEALAHVSFGDVLRGSAGFVAGLFAGAVCSAGAAGTISSGGIAGPAAFAGCGAVGSAAGQLVDNGVNGDPLLDNVIQSATIGAATALATYGAGRLIAGSSIASPGPGVGDEAAMAMDSFMEAGATVHWRVTGIAIGDDSATMANLARSQENGYNDIIVHGSREGDILVEGLPTNPQQVAQALLDNPLIDPDLPLQFVSCWGACRAQELADTLGVPVVAGTGRVQLDPFGNLLPEAGSDLLTFLPGAH